MTDDRPAAPLPDAPATPAAGRIWYYFVGGRSFGPVTEQELDALARAGYFRPDDHVYAPHLGNWVLAKSVHGLFDSVGIEAPVAPSESPRPLYVPGPQSPFGPEILSGYAGFWRRFFAELIDLSLLALFLVPSLYYLARVYTRWVYRFGGDLTPILISDEVCIVLICLALVLSRWPYYALFESRRLSATPGKLCAGIIVTDLYGKRISFGRATMRYLGSLISTLAAFFGYLIMLFTARNQTLHDVFANTIVLNARFRDPSGNTAPPQ